MEIQDKTQKKLAAWKSASLSMDRRVVLVKAMTTAFPTYVMHSVKMPKEICSKLDRINRDFLWGSTNDKKKIVHNVNWDVVGLEKNKGGLSVKHMKDYNQSLLAKAS
ncbi:hypothetical protein ACOSQ2_007208 [Xanthoceras sorbifolium]